MKFVLTIDIGNDAMQTGDDVADAVRQVSRNLAANIDTFRPDDTGRVFDANGNTVGGWSIEA